MGVEQLRCLPDAEAAPQEPDRSGFDSDGRRAGRAMPWDCGSGGVTREFGSDAEEDRLKQQQHGSDRKTVTHDER